MRRTIRIVLAALSAACVVIAVVAILIANHAYGYSTRWFAKATYVTECIPVPKPPNTAALCTRLAADAKPPAIDGVAPRSQSVLLAEGTALHDTGDGVLTLAGLSLAACGLLAGASTRLSKD